MWSSTSSRRRGSLALAVACALVPAASARAAELRADHACYVGGAEEVELTATGFRPGATVDFRQRGITVASVPANDLGQAQVRRRAPRHPGGRTSLATAFVEFSADQRDDPDTRAATRVSITNFTGSFSPRRPRPNRRMRIRLTGFLPGQRIYLHYVRGRRSVATRSLGRARGDCGRLTATVRRWPLRRVAAGRWRLQADARRRWSPRTRAQFFTVRLTRSYRLGR